MVQTLTYLASRPGSAAASGAPSTAAGAGLIQSYGVLLAAQPSLAALDTIGIPAEKHLESARNHMTSWINPTSPSQGLKARIQATIGSVIDWNNTFSSYWDAQNGFTANIQVLRSTTATDAQKSAAMNSIADKLGELSSGINGFDADARSLTESLTTFEADLVSDHHSFESDFAAFLKQKDDKNSKLGEIKAKLDGVNAQVHKDIAIIATSTVVLVGTVGVMAYTAYIDFDFGELAAPLVTIGLGVVATSLFEIVSRSGELHSLQTQASDLEAQIDLVTKAVAAASLLSNNLRSLGTACGKAVTGIHQIATAWTTLRTDLDQVVADCRSGLTANAQTIAGWLEQTKLDWAAAQDACERIKNLDFKSKGLDSNGKVRLIHNDMIQEIRSVGTRSIDTKTLSELPTATQNLEYCNR